MVWTLLRSARAVRLQLEPRRSVLKATLPMSPRRSLRFSSEYPLVAMNPIIGQPIRSAVRDCHVIASVALHEGRETKA